MVTNEVETGASRWYPELQPQHYDAAPDDVFDAVERVVRKRPRWELAQHDRQAGTLAFTSTTRRMGFVDDVTVHISPDLDGSRVSVHSRSRTGKGDLGKNASRIREFFDLLAVNLRDHKNSTSRQA